MYLLVDVGEFGIVVDRLSHDFGSVIDMIDSALSVKDHRPSQMFRFPLYRIDAWGPATFLR